MLIRMTGRDVSQLLGIDLDALDDAGVESVLREVEELSRRLAAFGQDVVAQLDSRAIPLSRGYKNTIAYLRDVLRLSPGEARARTRMAEATSARRALTGERLEPIFPSIAAAQHAGQISREHAQLIVRIVDGLPHEVAAEYDRSVETFLVGKARELDPKALGTVAERVKQTLDPDGTLETFEERHRRRNLRIRPRPDGSSHIEGDLTAEFTELLLTVRDALGKPRSTPDAPDGRTFDQRTHDAVMEGMSRLVRSELLPDVAGVKATVVLHMDAETYATSTGYATTGHGYRIPVTEAKRWATADHDIIAVLLNRTRRIEAYSDKQRIYTKNQRYALWARDRGCSFPGCDAPPGWCEVHHVIEFQDGGPTDTDNGALLCDWHHDNHSRLEWHCVMRDGTPAWIPPAWLDPEQKPRRNSKRA